MREKDTVIGRLVLSIVRVLGVVKRSFPTFYYAAPSFRDVIREYTLAAGEQQRFVERYWKIPS